MLFNSLEFLLFFPLVTLMYFLLPHKWRWLHLLVASCVFYMAFIPVYILILFFTIIIDYAAGIIIENASGKRRKLFLIISLISNIGILFVFKYYNFFITNINTALPGYQLSLLNIILPIGLSFHTFQAMSYTIEVYRGHQKAEKHFGIYALYVMFYPQLVAGPIERPQNLLHQFHEKHYFSRENLWMGLQLMVWGLFKKVVIADRLSYYVNLIYEHPESASPVVLLLTMLFFSGYSDIAIGAAKTMGFDLMTNFNRPYFSKNIHEFWSRWHISLSTWFRDYLYIPLGGNRVKQWKIYRNVLIVFLISGFWHGANWTFIIWGAIHAVMTVGYMVIRNHVFKKEKSNSWLSALTGWFVTFSVVTLAWVFFRAETATKAIYIIRKVFDLSNLRYYFNNSGQIDYYGLGIIGFLLLLLVLAEAKVSPKMFEWSNRLFPKFAIGAAVLLIICFGVFSRNSFIYFQF